MAPHRERVRKRTLTSKDREIRALGRTGRGEAGWRDQTAFFLIYGRTQD
jgi:hypothetical protein